MAPVVLIYIISAKGEPRELCGFRASHGPTEGSFEPEATDLSSAGLVWEMVVGGWEPSLKKKPSFSVSAPVLCSFTDLQFYSFPVPWPAGGPAAGGGGEHPGCTTMAV